MDSSFLVRDKAWPVGAVPANLGVGASEPEGPDVGAVPAKLGVGASEVSVAADVLRGGHRGHRLVVDNPFLGVPDSKDQVVAHC